MAKKECKDGRCEVGVPDLTINKDDDKKGDKKDSSKRLR